MPDVYPVILEELEGQRRRVTLEASALPFQGVEAGVSQRLVKTYYPGTTRASVQVMGTEEGDVVLTGRLSDVLLGEAGGAEALVAKLRALVVGQRPVQLTWGAVVRRGFVQSFVPNYSRRDSVGYEITFSPDEADDAAVVAVPYQATTATDVLSILDLLREVESAMDEAIAVNNLLAAIL